MNPRRGFAFPPHSLVLRFPRLRRGRLGATRAERREQGREIVHHERLTRIGRFEVLQEAECRERRLAFDETRGVGEVAQCGGFTACAFKRGLAFLLGLEHFAEGLAEFARQHHVAHLEPRGLARRRRTLGGLHRVVDRLPDFALCRCDGARYFAAMNVEEFKAEAAKLPPNDRCALAEWIEQSEDIRDLRRAALVREIEVGLHELERGESVECKDDAELRSFFDGVKARGRELLGARKKSAA